MKYRRPKGAGSQSQPAAGENGTFFKVPSAYKHAIGHLPASASEFDDVPSASRREVWAWAAATLVLAIIGFAWLELKGPMFFNHGDNFNAMGPSGIYRCRSVLSGVFPAWNPFQGGGRPIVEAGGALTYLPNYFAYGISCFLLGNEYLYVEATACFNLLLAAAGGFWAGRKWGLSPALACAFGLSFAFSGFMIITTRAWMNFSSTSAWIPWMLGCCAPALLRKASWKWALGAGAVMGVAFHSGFSQLWVYAILCECLIIVALFFCGAISFRNMCWNIPAALIAVAIALPVAWIQMDFGKDVMRDFSESVSAYDSRGISWKALLAALIPPPGISMTHPVFSPYEAPAQGYVNSHGYGVYYYSGAVFSWGCIFLLASLAVVRWSRRMVARNILVLFAAFVLLLSLGSASPIPLNRWMSALPWFEKFRQPWRYYIFFVFFSSLAGALFFERLCGSLRNRRFAQRTVAITAIAFIGASLAVPIPVWMLRPPCPVYPALTPGLNAVIKDPAAQYPSRVVSWTRQSEQTAWLQSKDYPDTLIAFMPTLYEVLSLNRYSTITWYHKFSRPMFERFNKDPLNAWRAYGVRWIVCHPKIPPVDAKLFRAWRGKAIKVGNITLLELRDSAPLAFVKGLDKEPLPISFSAKGATVEFPAATTADQQVVVNVLGWPRFKAYADGRLIPWTPDEWERVLVSVPAKTKKLEVLYKPVWGAGIGAGMLLFAVALGVSCAFSWFDRRFPAAGAPSYGPWKTRLINAWPAEGWASRFGRSGRATHVLPNNAAEETAPEEPRESEAPQQSAPPRKSRKKR